MMPGALPTLKKTEPPAIQANWQRHWLFSTTSSYFSPNIRAKAKINKCPFCRRHGDVRGVLVHAFTLCQRSNTLEVKPLVKAEILHCLHMWKSSAGWFIAIATMEPDEGVGGRGGRAHLGLIRFMWVPTDPHPSHLSLGFNVRSIRLPVDLLAELPAHLTARIAVTHRNGFFVSISWLPVKWQPSRHPSAHYGFRSSKWNFASLVPIRDTCASMHKTRFERMVPLQSLLFYFLLMHPVLFLSWASFHWATPALCLILLLFRECCAGKISTLSGTLKTNSVWEAQGNWIGIHRWRI